MGKIYDKKKKQKAENMGLATCKKSNQSVKNLRN